MIGNRTLERAKSLAVKYNAQAFGFASLKEVLSDADILISATSAPHLIVHSADLNQEREMLLIDLSRDGDIESSAGTLPGKKLITLRDLDSQLDQNRQAKHNQLHKTELIVAEEVENFINDLKKRKTRRNWLCI